jgi:hypothetical protein
VVLYHTEDVKCEKEENGLVDTAVAESYRSNTRGGSELEIVLLRL